MVDVIDDIRDEHVAIARVLDIVEQELERMQRGEQVDYEILLDAAFYLTEYSDLFHHTKEDLVYRRLRRRRRRAADLVSGLEGEHETLRRLGLAVAETVEDVTDDVMVDRADLERRIREYVLAQREHMEREEREFLPLAEKTLTEEDWAEIRSTLASGGASGVRDITRERFRSLYRRLSG